MGYLIVHHADRALCTPIGYRSEAGHLIVFAGHIETALVAFFLIGRRYRVQEVEVE